MRTITKRTGETTIEGESVGPSITMPYIAKLDLMILKIMWTSCGEAFERLCDGFGPGAGTGPDGDWSAIRDSSDEAKTKMLEHSLNVLEEMTNWCGEWPQSAGLGACTQEATWRDEMEKKIKSAARTGCAEMEND